MPTELRPRKIGLIAGHVICAIVALILGVPLWIIWKLAPDLFPFVLVWLIVRPVWKIWKELEL